jgi:hypothetical protein
MLVIRFLRFVIFVLKNSLLEFARVVKAREQVVAGTLHHLTLEAIDGGEKKIYEAKVWVKPWLNFKELQEFKHASDGGAPSFTSADLGVLKGMPFFVDSIFLDMTNKLAINKGVVEYSLRPYLIVDFLANICFYL